LTQFHLSDSPLSLSLLYPAHLHLHSFPTRRSSDLISFAASSASIDVTGMSVQELMISSTSFFVTSIISSPTDSRSALKRSISSLDRKSTRLNSSHEWISYAVFCLKKKNIQVRLSQT